MEKILIKRVDELLAMIYKQDVKIRELEKRIIQLEQPKQDEYDEFKNC